MARARRARGPGLLGQRAVIFVSVGTMMPFDRLVRTMDGWAAAHPDMPVTIQIGSTPYEPVHARFVRLMPAAEYRRAIAAARLFVAHAGMGSIITAIEAGKPLLMLPRLKAEGEHNTDHQLATARTIGNRPGLHVADDADDLLVRLDALLADSGRAPAPIARYAAPLLIGHVRAFIHGSNAG